MKSFDFLRDPIAGLLGQALRAELPRRFIAPALFGAGVLACVASWTAVDARALRSARAMQVQTESRIGRLDRQMETLRIEREALQVTQRRMSRLWELRRSGLRTADRIARLGNALGDRTWAASISTRSSAASLKGEADGVARLSDLVANVVRDRETGELSSVRFSSGLQAPGRLTFELQIEGFRHGDDR